MLNEFSKHFRNQLNFAKTRLNFWTNFKTKSIFNETTFFTLGESCSKHKSISGNVGLMSSSELLQWNCCYLCFYEQQTPD